MSDRLVFVAISGGVDSAHAAYLLQEQGYRVFGVFMDLGLGYEELDRAKYVAFSLGIPLQVVRLKEEFESLVVDYFVSEYLSGRTPNPCAVCNKRVKFGLLKRKVEEMGGELFATGHYACLVDGTLHRGRDRTKDQSYFLCLVERERFSNVLFPLCGFFKRDLNLVDLPWGRAESQEICFLKGKSYREFLLERVGERPGRFVDTSGRFLGEHKGYFLFTIGQRRGLGIALGKPLYVVDIVPDENLVVLGDEGDLYRKRMRVESMNLYVSMDAPQRVKAKIRNKHEPACATLYPDGLVEFDEPQRAITPGQIACFYQDDAVLAGAVISSVS